MITVDYSFFVEARAEQVFTFLGNPTNNPRWAASCESARLLDTDPISVDTCYEIVFNFLTRRMSFKGVVEHYEPPSRLGFRTVDGPFSYQDSYRLEPKESGTQVDWQFRADPGRFFGVIPVTLIRKALLKQIEKDTGQLQALLRTPLAVSA